MSGLGRGDDTVLDITAKPDQITLSMANPVQYVQSLPSRGQFSQETVLFYDSVLIKNRALKSWIDTFEHRIDLKSGESLKTLRSLGAILQRLELLGVSKTSELAFVALGGGSIGDFVGFLASIYWRGRKLINIPSTWLAAVDSAHGGKNGLNVDDVKNQLGTFYPAEKIIICRDQKPDPRGNLQSPHLKRCHGFRQNL